MAAPVTVSGQKVIPTAWEERILKRDFYVVLGKMLQSKQQDATDTEEPYLRSANVQWGGVDISDIKTMWFSPKEKRELLLRRGDLVVNEGGDVGRCAIWKAEIDECYFQNAVNRVRARRSASTRFLYYWLYNTKSAGIIDAIVGRTTIAHLTAEKLEALPWPDVPSVEQERIAAYLDASCAGIDAAVTAKRRQLEVLDDLHRLIIAKAVTRGLDESVELKESGVEVLGPIPRHWRRTKLRYEVSIRSGDFASDKLEDEGEYPVIGGNGQMGRTAEHNVDGEIVVVGRVGAYCGNAHYVKGRAWVSDNALIVESSHDKRFLMHLFRAIDFNSMARKTAQPLVTGTQIKNTYVALPQLAEQKLVVEFIQQQTSQFDALRGNLANQIETLIAYRKSLIHECVTGQRRISEADLNRPQAHG